MDNNNLEELEVRVNDIFKGQVKSKSRKRNHVNARIAFSNIARTQFKYPFHFIGDYIGKDHASIIHYNNQFEGVYKSDENFRERYNKLAEFNYEEKTIESLINKINHHFRMINRLNKRLKICSLEVVKNV